ncbi:MAG: Ig-like domain-containing protein [Clostridia bacterium]|nr:Ig-like domain-containing protein [Clostridia bacterium]
MYTRIKPTESTDSFYVARNILYLNDSNYLSNIELEGYTSYGPRNVIHVPKNESVTININKNPFDADKWSNFKFKTPYTSSLITLSVTEEIVSGSPLPESLTITAGDTTGAITFGAYYNDVAMNYGTWQVVVYDPEKLPVSMLKPKLEQNILGLFLTVGDSAMPNYDAQSAELTAEEAEQFDLIWQVCSQAPTTSWGTPTFGEENEYLKVDPATGLVTAKAEIPEDASYLYRNVYLFAVRKSDSSKTQMTSYTVTVYPVGTVLVEGVTVSPETLGLIPGGSAELTATLFPANAEGNTNFAWKSSDETIATVDENGKVTAVSEGSVVITVTHTDSGKEGSCNVIVSNNTISLAQATITTPVADSTPDMSINVPKDENYIASIEYWCVEGQDETPLTGLDTFESGKTYNVCIKFTATNGYLFTEKTHFSLNGQEVTTESTNGTEAIISKTFECSEATTEVLCGDVNGDEKITMEDVVLIQKEIAKLVELKDNEKLAADVNFDEKITMEDVVLIQKYIAKLISSFDKK